MAVVIVLAVVLNAGFYAVRSRHGWPIRPSSRHSDRVAGAFLPARWRRTAWRPALTAGAGPSALRCSSSRFLWRWWGHRDDGEPHDRLDNVAMAERPAKALEQAGRVITRLRSEWQLSAWVDRPDRLTC
jgi:hypothetical protein